MKDSPKSQARKKLEGKLKCAHVWITGVPEREKREKGGKKVNKTNTFIHIYIHTSRLFPRTEENVWVYILKESISSQNNGLKRNLHQSTAQLWDFKTPGKMKILQDSAQNKQGTHTPNYQNQKTLISQK